MTRKNAARSPKSFYVGCRANRLRCSETSCPQNFRTLNTLEIMCPEFRRRNHGIPMHRSGGKIELVIRVRAPVSAHVSTSTRKSPPTSDSGLKRCFWISSERFGVECIGQGPWRPFTAVVTKERRQTPLLFRSCSTAGFVVPSVIVQSLSCQGIRELVSFASNLATENSRSDGANNPPHVRKRSRITAPTRLSKLRCRLKLDNTISR